MTAGSGAIPHPAVSFYTCPTSILTISFQINVLSCTKWVFRGVLFRENVLGGTKCALCEKIGGCIIETNHMAGEMNCEMNCEISHAARAFSLLLAGGALARVMKLTAGKSSPTTRRPATASRMTVSRR